MLEGEALAPEPQDANQVHQFLYKKSIDLLSRREHSRAELAQKLRMKSKAEAGLVEAVLMDLLDDLVQLGYLSDERYAEMMIRSRFEKGQGPIRIRLELKQKGVSSELIEANFDAFDADWFESAAKVQRKRFSEKPADMAARVKQMRFLTSRGFSADQIDYALS